MELRDLKVGDFVRTKDGIIDKITISYDGKCNNPNCNCKHISCEHNYYDEKDIIKASDKLIDLVEVEDYVNGCKVVEILKETIIIENYGEEELFEKDIKRIVTKEMFDQISYKVGA